MATDLKFIRVGSFNNVDLYFFNNTYRVTAAHFNRKNDLVGQIELFDLPIMNEKRINVRILDTKGNEKAEFKDVKAHANFLKVKTINVIEFDSFILIKVVI